MSKHKPAFRPSVQEFKLKGKEDRYHTRQQHCFKAPTDSGAVCVLKKVDYDRQEGVDYPNAWGTSPEQYFDSAISEIPFTCPVDNYEPAVGNCTTNNSHSLHYTLNWKEGGARTRYTVRQLTNLEVNTLLCQDADKKWPSNTNLTDCIEGLLAQAQTKSADSFKAPPIWPALVIAGVALLIGAAIAVGLYTCMRKSRRASHNERTVELRQPLVPTLSLAMQDSTSQPSLEMVD